MSTDPNYIEPYIKRNEMPGNQSWSDFFKTRAPTSSAAHRNTERLNAGLQISTDVLQAFSPAVITTKSAQALVSMHAVFREDTYNMEKLLHASQTLLCLAQVALTITLYVQDNKCTTHNGLCKAAYICELVYQGILLAGWGASEFSKDLPDSLVPTVPEP
jgi:hypothetical protein